MLIDGIDSAAERLLKRVGIESSIEGEKANDDSLAEQVKAFIAACEWVKTRKELQPPKKKASAFERINREFSRNTASSGGSPDTSQDEPVELGPDDGDDDDDDDDDEGAERD